MMIFLRILIISNHIFFAELNENNFYMKIIDLDEIYNFLVLSFFHLKSLRCSKKLIIYLNLRAFSSFHTCSLTALEPKLTKVAWMTRKSWSSGAEDRWIFSGAYRGFRSLIMAHREKSLQESRSLGFSLSTRKKRAECPNCRVGCSVRVFSSLC